MENRFITFALAFFVVTLSVYILATAKGFFVPLLIAFVIAYLIITFVEGIKKHSVGGRQFSTFLAYFVTFTLLFLVVSIVLSILTQNVTAMIESAPIYQERLKNLTGQLEQFVKIKDLFDMPQHVEKLNIVGILSQFVGMLTEIAGSIGLIALYVMFILIEHRFFDQKLQAFFKSAQQRKTAHKLIERIASQIQSYLRIKVVLSFLTATCSYLVLIAVGVDFATFWAFLIFLFNFIPTIGSIIATVFPCLLALLQFDTFVPFFIVTLGLSTIQFAVGNFLEPRVMGKSFNLSGLVIILSLTIWGSIWGVVGMLLCVPIIVIGSIILSNFSQTRPIAVLLSQDGKVESND